MNNQTVCVIGLWHLGLVSAASLAELGHQVRAYDSNETLVKELQEGKLPLYEPGLNELVQKNIQSGRLLFNTDFAKGVRNAPVVLIAYDTPVDQEDRVDLDLLNRTLESIIPNLASDALLVINSQVPVGSCDQWLKMIRKKRPKDEIDLVCSPENIRLGQAINLFRQPDMIVIGSDSDRARLKAERFYTWIACEKFYVSLKTAEMSKHALNSFFATSISFANEIGNLCDAVGADGIKISEILKKDNRIGKKAQVRPGLGFAGATLARDLRSLQTLGKRHHVQTQLIDDVLSINQKQLHRVIEIIEQHFKGSLKQKTLTIFGLTYKPGTSTLRRSASLEVIRAFQLKGAFIRSHDPKADLKEYSGTITFEHHIDPYEAVQKSDGIILMTEWPEYRDLNYSKIKAGMTHPMILDAKNHLDGESLKALGFTYLEIGRGQLAR